MRSAVCFSLIFSLFASTAIAAEVNKAVLFEEPTEISLYNYSSDKCHNLNDPAKLYEIAIELRDSKDPKDQVGAVDCMVSAAFRGYNQAEYELARMYYIGFIVTQNKIFAYRWAELAVIDGNPEAKGFRDTLEDELSLGEVNAAMAQAKKIQSERSSGGAGVSGRQSSRIKDRNANRASRQNRNTDRNRR